MKRKTKKRSIFVAVVLLLMIYMYHTSNYSISEKGAIKKSYLFQDGVVTYNKYYGSKNIIVWKTNSGYYDVKLLDKKLAVFHYVSNFSSIDPMIPLEGVEEGVIKRTWSASLNSNKLYNTIIAVQSDHPEIVKVIVSNDNVDYRVLYNLNEVKENSTVFLELTLEDGVAATYNEFNSTDAGGFVFRGLNESGEVIAIGR